MKQQGGNSYAGSPKITKSAAYINPICNFFLYIGFACIKQASKIHCVNLLP